MKKSKKKDDIKTLEEIKKEVEEPKYDVVEKYAQISETPRGLITRIPNDIEKNYKIKGGDFLKFRIIYEEKKKPRLEITLEEKNAKKTSRK